MAQINPCNACNTLKIQELAAGTTFKVKTLLERCRKFGILIAHLDLTSKILQQTGLT